MPVAYKNSNGTTSGATQVTVVAAPASAAARIIPIGGLSVYNADSVATNDLTIQLDDATTNRAIKLSSNVAVGATIVNDTVINLETTGQSLEIVLGGAATTTEMDYVVSYLEVT